MSYFPMVPYHGGVQRVTNILSYELERRGHNVCFLCYDDNERIKNEKLSVDFPQYYIDIKNNDESPDQINQFLFEHKIDCLISQEQDELNCKILKAIKKDVRVISVHHTVPFADYNATRQKIWRSMSSHTLRMVLIKIIALISPRYYIRRRINTERRVFEKTIQYSDRFVFISERFLKRVSFYLPNCPEIKLAAINDPNTFDASTPVKITEKRISMFLICCIY